MFWVWVVSFYLTTSVSAAAFFEGDEGGAVSGLVTDPAGAVLIGARVLVTQQPGGQAREVATDKQGRYALKDLPQGRYTVEAQAQGFLSLSREVSLSAGEQAKVDFVLPLPTFGESVLVTARAGTDLERVAGGSSVVPPAEIEQSRAVNLKDALGFTPGVLAQSRFGADESQLSVRGSGLRNNFHLRGINLLINSIPYQDADGFSDFESLELMATERIEVWKGANALRFGGNSMGGAINFVTPTGLTAPRLQLRLQGGSFGTFKGQLATGGRRGSLRHYLSFSDTELDGYRAHSQQGRQRFFGNFGFTLDERTDLRVDLVYANVSEKLPGSLTAAEFQADPQQADPVNVAQDWGRFYDFVRAGVGLTRRLGAGQELELIAFGQYRNMDHPIFLVLDQDGRTFGAEVRYRVEGSLGGRADRLVLGFAPQVGDISERRYVNLNGQRGPLVALFGTEALNYGFYFENQLDLAPQLTFIAGGRVDRATRRFEDRFLADGDRSDERVYSAFSPRFGLLFRAGETQIFGNLSRSYEPPLLLELTSFGAPGFLDLKAQDAWQYEVGTRGRRTDRLSWDFSFFDVEIEDEILNVNVTPFPFAPFTIPSYRNAPKTRHLGVELGGEVGLGRSALAANDRLRLRLAYTWSRFRFVEDPAYTGKFLPGAPPHILRSELRYEHPRGIWVAPMLDWCPASYFVDSANTARNEAYAVVNLKAGYEGRKLGLYFELQNLTDRLYSASVQVDNALGRYYEPTAGRSAYLGLRYRF